MAVRPLVATGAALASAVAIVVTAPTILPNAADKTYITTPSAFTVPPARHPTLDYYEQMEVTVPGLLDAFFKGYGSHDPADKSAACAFCPAEPPAASNHPGSQPPPTARPVAPAADVTESAALHPDVVVTVPLRWGNVREAIVDAADLVRGFLFNGGPIGAIRVIVRWVSDGLYRQPDAQVVTAMNPASATDGVEEVGQRSEEAEPEAPELDRPSGRTLPSLEPEQKEPAPGNDRVGAKATIDDSDEETKTRSQLRREVIKERLQERREDAKERRQLAKERRAAIKQRVNDAVKRFTGGDTDNDTDTDTGGTDNDKKKDGTDPGE